MLHTKTQHDKLTVQPKSHLECMFRSASRVLTLTDTQNWKANSYVIYIYIFTFVVCAMTAAH